VKSRPLELCGTCAGLFIRLSPRPPSQRNYCAHGPRCHGCLSPGQGLAEVVLVDDPVAPVDHPGTEVAHGRLEARDPMPGVGAAPRLRGDHTRPWRGAHLAHTRQKAT
jgi:hypothetical protein